MSDDLTLDFTDVQSSNFDVLPTGWYLCEVTGFNDVETKRDGKMGPAGIPGTNWEFTVIEGEQENRKLWTNHWHHPKTLGMLKGLIEAAGIYEEFPEKLDVEQMREDMEGVEVYVKVKVRTSEQYGESNDVQTFRNKNRPPASTGGAATSMMP